MKRSFFLAVFLAGCGDGNTQQVMPPNDNPTSSVTDQALSLTTGKFTVPTGDSFECFFTDVISDREWTVNGASGHQGPGGHHILVYYSTVPPKPVGHHPCVDAEMAEWRQLAGSAGHGSNGAEGVISLPEGLAWKVPAHRQIVVQAHYINATSTPVDTNDQITVNFADPAKIKAYVNYLAGVDDQFQIMPQQRLKRVYRCTVPNDLNVVLLLGHMHEYGKHFKWELLDDKGMPTQTLYDQTWEPSFTSHPPISYFTYDKPLLLKKGTQMQQTCEWENTSNNMLSFPREMCVSFSYYYPDNGELFCEFVSVQ